MREPIAIRDEVGADAAEPREAGQYVISSALRTLQVLRAFAEPPHRLGLADVTSRLGLEKNQAYRSLKTLEAAGFLTPDGEGRYQVTELARSLARTEPTSPKGAARAARERTRAGARPRYERRKTVAAD